MPGSLFELCHQVIVVSPPLSCDESSLPQAANVNTLAQSTASAALRVFDLIRKPFRSAWAGCDVRHTCRKGATRPPSVSIVVDNVFHSSAIFETKWAPRD